MKITRYGWTGVVLVMALGVTPLEAVDKVELKSGDVFYGRVLRYNRQEVSIQLASGGTLSFHTHRVVKLRISDGVRPTKTLWPPDFLDPDKTEEVKETIAVIRASKPRKPPAPAPGEALPEVSPPPEPAEPPAPVAPVSPAVAALRSHGNATGTEPVIDRTHGFSVKPPPGLARTTEALSPEVFLDFEDPLSQSKFTVSGYASSDDVAEFKEKITRSYASRVGTFRVVEDTAIQLSERQAHLIEMESELGGALVRQLQLFTRSGPEILILTYSCSANEWVRYRVWFYKSINSLEILPRTTVDDNVGDDTADDTDAAEKETSDLFGADEPGLDEQPSRLTAPDAAFEETWATPPGD